MLTLEDIKLELDIEGTENDAKIERIYARVKDFVKEYTGLTEVPDNGAIDDMYLYLIALRLNESTSYKNAAGKQVEGVGGYTVTFSEQLTPEMKKILDGYKRKWF